MALDNQAAIMALTINSRQLGQHILDDIHMQLKSLHHVHRHLKVHVKWVLGHMNIAGNEATDELVKKAAEGISSPQQNHPPLLQNTLPISIVALKVTHKMELWLSWTKLWKTSSRFIKISHIDPHMPSNKAYGILTSCPRHGTCILTQLCTG